jgi:hypothetical protein
MRALSVAFFVLAACGASRVPFSSYAAGPAVAPSQVGDRELYEASVKVFTAHGLALAEADGVGTVASRPVVVRSGTTRTLHAWRAVVRDGSLQLVIDCVEQSAAGEQACEDSLRAVPWQQKAPALRAEIFAEAERLAETP